eukprot:6489208-Amphidinium_carterae.2
MMLTHALVSGCVSRRVTSKVQALASGCVSLLVTNEVQALASGKHTTQQLSSLRTHTMTHNPMNVKRTCTL